MLVHYSSSLEKAWLDSIASLGIRHESSTVSEEDQGWRRSSVCSYCDGSSQGNITKCDRTHLAEFGGPVQLNRQWAHSLLKCMKFVKRKPTTAKSKQTAANFEDVVTTVEMEEFPPEPIMNWDQTGIKIVPCQTWTMK